MHDYEDELKVNFYIIICLLAFCSISNILIFLYGNHIRNSLDESHSATIEVGDSTDRLAYLNSQQDFINELLDTINSAKSNLVKIFNEIIINILCSLLTSCITIIPLGIILAIYKNTTDFPNFGKYYNMIIYSVLALNIYSCYSNVKEAFSYLSFYQKIFTEIEQIYNSLTIFINNPLY